MQVMQAIFQNGGIIINIKRFGRRVQSLHTCTKSDKSGVFVVKLLQRKDTTAFPVYHLGDYDSAGLTLNLGPEGGRYPTGSRHLTSRVENAAAIFTRRQRRAVSS
jgi:hypothetical protein